jgi:hypothetical protein
VRRGGGDFLRLAGGFGLNRNERGLCRRRRLGGALGLAVLRGPDGLNLRCDLCKAG